VAELAGGFHRLVVGGIVAEEVEVGWHCTGGVAVPAEALASAPTGEGS
jgi:hypothetical protein